MKARIKATGEVLKIADYSKLTMESCDSYGTPLEYAPEEIELIDDAHIDGGIDWEQRRYEIAKEIYAGGLIHPDGDVRSYSYSHMRQSADEAIMEADALIKALKSKL